MSRKLEPQPGDPKIELVSSPIYPEGTPPKAPENLILEMTPRKMMFCDNCGVGTGHPPDAKEACPLCGGEVVVAPSSGFVLG